MSMRRRSVAMLQVSKLRYRLRSTYAKWQIIFIHLISISASGGVRMSLYKYIHVHIVSDSTNSYYRVKTMFCAWWIYGKRKTLRTWHFGASTQRITYYTRYRYLFKQYILEKKWVEENKDKFPRNTVVSQSFDFADFSAAAQPSTLFVLAWSYRCVQRNVGHAERRRRRVPPRRGWRRMPNNPYSRGHLRLSPTRMRPA